jgi:hypothetical protein
MRQQKTLSDLLQQTREPSGDEVVYRFANGLTIKTEIFNKSDRWRILPLGTPQGSLMNHMLHFPGTVRDKHVLEPFAGSGALGFMALKAGARHVDFLDINPRAADFQRQNAELNQVPSSRFTAIQGDIATFAPQRKYDLIVANPPFVPTPAGIEGTITSNGGPEGNRFVEILLERLEEFLEPSGRALIYVFQLVRQDAPLVLDLLAKTVGDRSVELTPSQARPTSFETYCRAYSHLFADAAPAVDRWRADMVRRHGDGLTLCHYVVDVGPRSHHPTGCVISDNFAEKFGDSFLVPSESDEELAFARVWENVVPEGGDS